MFFCCKPIQIGRSLMKKESKSQGFQAFKLFSDRFVLFGVFGFLSFQTLWYFANLNLWVSVRGWFCTSIYLYIYIYSTIYRIYLPLDAVWIHPNGLGIRPAFKMNLGIPQPTPLMQRERRRGVGNICCRMRAFRRITKSCKTMLP